MRLCAAALAASVLCVPASAQAPPDVKGWRGAEWGMTPEEVAAVLGIPLSGREFYEKVVATIPCLNVRNHPFDNWANGVFSCFDDEQPGLSSISLGIDPAKHDFAAVLRDLISSYGDPVRIDHEKIAGIVQDKAIWLFPSTEIRLSRVEVRGPPAPLVSQSVAYVRRTAKSF